MDTHKIFSVQTSREAPTIARGLFLKDRSLEDAIRLIEIKTHCSRDDDLADDSLLA